MTDQTADNSAESVEPAQTQEGVAQADPTPAAQPQAEGPAAQESGGGGETEAQPKTIGEWISSYMSKQAAKKEGPQQEQEPTAQAQQPEPAPAPEPGTVPAQEPPATEPQQQELILGKFRTQADLEKAYREAERKIHETGQTLSQYERELQAMKQPQAPQEGQPGQQEQQRQDQVKDALKDMTPEERENWYYKLQDPDTGVDAYLELIDLKLQQVVQPIAQRVQQREQQEVWSRQIAEAQHKHEDFNALVPEIEKAMGDPHNAYIASAPNPFEAAYNLVKSRQVLDQGQTPPTAQPSPETLLQDEAFRQKVMQDPKLRDEILKNYAQGVKQGKPPVVIGSQPGGQPPAAPTEQIKSAKDATKHAKSYFQRMLGGSS